MAVVRNKDTWLYYHTTDLLYFLLTRWPASLAPSMFFTGVPDCFLNFILHSEGQDLFLSVNQTFSETKTVLFYSRRRFNRDQNKYAVWLASVAEEPLTCKNINSSFTIFIYQHETVKLILHKSFLWEKKEVKKYLFCYKNLTVVSVLNG